MSLRGCEFVWPEIGRLDGSENGVAAKEERLVRESTNTSFASSHRSPLIHTHSCTGQCKICN